MAQLVSAAPPGPQAARIADYWTPERRASAIPRDLVIDDRGLGYLRRPNGALVPYGHSVAAAVPQLRATTPESTPVPRGKPGGSDTTAPVITTMSPAEGTTIGSSHTFSATVTDESGLKSVSFVIIYPSGATQSFSAGSSDGTAWRIDFSGFTDGDWGWYVVARDNGARGGNTSTSPALSFHVDTSNGGGGGSGGTGNGDIVTNAPWSDGGTVQTAAGRLYFEMPGNSKWKGPWKGYVCSGTVVTDLAADRSIILTAAHCVYDDANKAFARNVLFIPDQAGTTAAGTDRTCSNDPLGCWAPAFGVVDRNWTSAIFPDNIPWDYAYYVVPGTGAHQPGYTGTGSESLEVAAGTLPLSFATPNHDDGTSGATSLDFTYALGYSYSDDPDFMYCAKDMTLELDYGDWWLASCGLSGGASGGPWIQTDNTAVTPAVGEGPIISVNSWGYTTLPGMAGPRLDRSSAACLLDNAEAKAMLIDGDDGLVGYVVDDPQDCPQP